METGSQATRWQWLLKADTSQEYSVPFFILAISEELLGVLKFHLKVLKVLKFHLKHPARTFFPMVSAILSIFQVRNFKLYFTLIL